MILLIFIQNVFPHMAMKNPPPRGSKYNPNENKIDYSLTSPLGPDRPFPCGGKPKRNSVKTYKAGETIKVEFDGAAPHNGGHCQFALSKDDKKFIVIQTILDRCPLSLSEQIKIPDNTPSGEFTFAWTWINRTGNREYYMNCADITINGVKGGRLKGKELLVVNLLGNETIPEFTNGGSGGKELLNSMPETALTSDGSTSSAPSTNDKHITSRSAPSTESDSPTESTATSEKSTGESAETRSLNSDPSAPSSPETAPTNPQTASPTPATQAYSQPTTYSQPSPSTTTQPSTESLPGSPTLTDQSSPQPPIEPQPTQQTAATQESPQPLTESQQAPPASSAQESPQPPADSQQAPQPSTDSPQAPPAASAQESPQPSADSQQAPSTAKAQDSPSPSTDSLQASQSASTQDSPSPQSESQPAIDKTETNSTKIPLEAPNNSKENLTDVGKNQRCRANKTNSPINGVSNQTLVSNSTDSLNKTIPAVEPAYSSPPVNPDKPKPPVNPDIPKPPVDLAYSTPPVNPDSPKLPVDSNYSTNPSTDSGYNKPIELSYSSPEKNTEYETKEEYQGHKY